MPTAAKFTQLSQKAVIGNNRFQKHYKQQIQTLMTVLDMNVFLLQQVPKIFSTRGSLIKKNKTRAFSRNKNQLAFFLFALDS